MYVTLNATNGVAKFYVMHDILTALIYMGLMWPFF